MNDAELIRQARRGLDDIACSGIGTQQREKLRQLEAKLNEMENRVTRRILGMPEALPGPLAMKARDVVVAAWCRGRSPSAEAPMPAAWRRGIARHQAEIDAITLAMEEHVRGRCVALVDWHADHDADLSALADSMRSMPLRPTPSSKRPR